MSRKFYDEDFENSEKVLKHLRRMDYLLIFLPMILSALLLVAVPVIWIASEYLRGNPTGIGGFDLGPLLIFAGIFFCIIFCVGYGLLALILSVLTRQNNSFRILLIIFSLLTATVFGILLFR